MSSPACTLEAALAADHVPAAADAAQGTDADRAVVCRCLEITASELVQAIRSRGLMTVREVGRCTGAGQGCTCCHETIRRYLLAHAKTS